MPYKNPKPIGSPAKRVQIGGRSSEENELFLKREASDTELATTRGCSSAGRAPALQAGGQEFDPPHLHHGTKDNE